jgi:hypothetical protein
MIRKLFIVARGNAAAYSSLQNSVGIEPDVAIIYDRRSGPSRVIDDERRQQPEIDEEIEAKGWVVVRNEVVDPGRQLEFATTRYKKLREIWHMPGDVHPRA